VRLEASDGGFPTGTQPTVPADRGTLRDFREVPFHVDIEVGIAMCSRVQPNLLIVKSLSTDYLVIGAGAMGMAFVDALIDNCDAHVTLVDRRLAPGGHWIDAYPFVQLHQASVFYGVASTLLGTGALQQSGPEVGLHDRARQGEVVAYYDDVLRDRLIATGRVEFLGGADHEIRGSTHVVVHRDSGEATLIDVRGRVVDATYLSPTIPATTPPPFGVAEDVRVVPINQLPTSLGSARTFVIVGSGKTATDGIVWLLTNGVVPDDILWVRPREPWMINRAVQQPDPAVGLRLTADILECAVDAESIDDFFLRLEAGGAMLRLDTSVMPTMAKAPTLGQWELELLRSVEHVVRLGHIKYVTPRELVLEEGEVELPGGSLLVHCAASGIAYPPRVPIWGSDRIRPQTIRAGFPCFGAALIGLVEATREDDEERNRLCPANALANTPRDWVRMQFRGAKAVSAFTSQSDIAAWANACALNPSRVEPEQVDLPDVRAASSRVASVLERGMASLAELGGEPLSP
jgi:hypothetical protein